MNLSKDNQKQIAIIIDSLSGGGAEKVVISLAEALVSLGHNPHIIALTNNIAYELSGNYPVHFVYQHKERLKGRLKRHRHASALSECVESVEKKFGKFDLFLANLEETYRVVSACNFGPCFYVIHNSLDATLKRTRLLGPIKYLYLKSILKMLNGKDLIAVSKGVEQELSSSQKIKPRSVCTIYNPFQIDQIRALALEPETGIPECEYILHVGRVARQKRHDILFEALQDVDSAVKLVCLCGDVKKARALAESYGVSDRVILPGFKKNPYPWMAQARALVVSSDYEGFCNVLLEAIVCGTVPVSTDCPHGPNEILRGELSKFLAPLRDPMSLAKTINLALHCEVDLAVSPIIELVQATVSAQHYLDLIND